MSVGATTGRGDLPGRIGEGGWSIWLGGLGAGCVQFVQKQKWLKHDPTYWHTRQESNLQPSILETDALPVAPLIRVCKKPRQLLVEAFGCCFYAWQIS